MLLMTCLISCFRRSRGFTFLELLITTLISALLVGCLVAMVAGAIRLWARAREFDGPGTEALLFLESLEKEFHNACLFFAAPFEGFPDSVCIPVRLRQGGTAMRLGAVRYQRDGRSGKLMRQAIIFPRSTVRPEALEPVVSGVENVTFSYLGGAGVADPWTWRERWVGERDLPAGIRVHLKIKDGGRFADIERTIYLPAAWNW